MPNPEKGGPSPEEMGLKPEQLQTSEQQPPQEPETPEQKLAAQYREQALKRAEKKGLTQESLANVDVRLTTHTSGHERNVIEGTIDGHRIAIREMHSGGKNYSVWFEGTVDDLSVEGKDAEKLFEKYLPAAELQGDYLLNKARTEVEEQQRRETEERQAKANKGRVKEILGNLLG
ncbi:MAG: hypothetical protein UU22_C0015G0010 [Parcubacteria group bacterium GW2011_GWA2_40_8]|nr:MAG: hypothetical protein UT82_C0008G0043 [Parcubacteria group bacterium GW2011_GWB1_40_14]KKR78733.1 MAG: hypothetical protein UU22_C0015G0010 [Parcubacteria group bacterium GW2011_GWA2_40_8]